jgi:uncharacterized membrane protein
MTTSQTALPNPLSAIHTALTRIEGSRWLLVPLLIVAAGLRFHDLDLQSLWYDELMTWMRTDFTTLPEVFASVRDDVWAPGYPLWAYFWQQVVGSSEWLLRFPAALAGVAGVAAIYTLGRRIADHRAGLFAALLLTVLQTPVYYAQEARPYAALILYTVLSTYFWWRINQRIAADERPPWAVMAAYIITTLIIVYYNYFGLVMLGTQGLMAGVWHIRTPRRWLPLAGVYAVIFLLYAPWVPETLADLGRESYYQPPPQSFRVELLTYFHVLMNLQPPWVNAQMVFVTLVLGVEGVRLARGERVPWRVWSFLFVWLLLPFTITYVYSALDSKSILVTRYLLISAPAAYLLLGFALTRLPLPRLAVSAAAALLAVGMVYNLLYGWDYYNRVTKTQYREAAAYVTTQEAAHQGDPLIIGYTGFSGTAIHFDYYFERLGARPAVRVDLDAGRVEAVREMVRESDAERAWLLVAFNQPDPAVLEALSEEYTLSEQRDFFQATVYRFER